MCGVRAPQSSLLHGLYRSSAQRLLGRTINLLVAVDEGPQAIRSRRATGELSHS